MDIAQPEAHQVLIDFNFRHFEPSDELISYVSERFHKLGKFDRKSVRAEVVFSYQKKMKIVAVSIRGSHLEIFARAESEDFFKSIDKVSEKLLKQLQRSKTRLKDSHRSQPRPLPAKVG